jgi:glycosyltransferase involved in cell wall biosynthesis
MPRQRRIGVASVHTPGITGGAELHAQGLIAAIKRAGHLVHGISMPFRFSPPSAIDYAMDAWAAQDFTRYGGGQIDRMICLKFPSYLLSYPNKIVWLLHQHRPAYDLFGSEFGLDANDPQALRLREAIIAADGRELASARAVHTNSQRVSARLLQYNGITAPPLYHPPADADAFHCKDALPYIFVPSRIETLKRQDLLIEAMARTQSPIAAIISGGGGQRARCEALAEARGLRDRIRFVGDVSRPELIGLYAHALGVFFGPLDEDYGYVTLEAMLSSKPVITCTDSGGPLEFVVDDETGIVCDPQADAIAAALDRLHGDQASAAAMGRAGRARYEAFGISWDHVADRLLGDLG